MIGPIRKRGYPVGILASAVVILLSACGQAAVSGSPSTAPPQTSASPPVVSPSAQPPTTPPAQSPSATPTQGAILVDTQSIPGIGTVLTNLKGLTLYHLTTDTSTMSSCSGQCAVVWPPLLTKSGDLQAPQGVKGEFGTIKRAGGGLQVTYNGMPLYTYSGDSAVGDTNGQGLGGVWFAVTAKK